MSALSGLSPLVNRCHSIALVTIFGRPDYDVRGAEAVGGSIPRAMRAHPCRVGMPEVRVLLYWVGMQAVLPVQHVWADLLEAPRMPRNQRQWDACLDEPLVVLGLLVAAQKVARHKHHEEAACRTAPRRSSTRDEPGHLVLPGRLNTAPREPRLLYTALVPGDDAPAQGVLVPESTHSHTMHLQRVVAPSRAPAPSVASSVAMCGARLHQTEAKASRTRGMCSARAGMHVPWNCC